MICPNTAAPIILPADCSTVWSIWPWRRCKPMCLLECSRWSTASTIITAPSTINPKSSAPKLIRFPVTPKRFIMPMANSMDSGITEATISPALRFPRKKTRINKTIIAPSSKLVFTVPKVRLTNLVRSRKVLISTPSGRVFSICFMRSSICPITFAAFAPFNMSTTAPETSPSSI